MTDYLKRGQDLLGGAKEQDFREKTKRQEAHKDAKAIRFKQMADGCFHDALLNADITSTYSVYAAAQRIARDIDFTMDDLDTFIYGYPIKDHRIARVATDNEARRRGIYLSALINKVIQDENNLSFYGKHWEGPMVNLGTYFPAGTLSIDENYRNIRGGLGERQKGGSINYGYSDFGTFEVKGDVGEGMTGGSLSISGIICGNVGVSASNARIGVNGVMSGSVGSYAKKCTFSVHGKIMGTGDIAYKVEDCKFNLTGANIACRSLGYQMKNSKLYTSSGVGYTKYVIVAERILDQAQKVDVTIGHQVSCPMIGDHISDSKILFHYLVQSDDICDGMSDSTLHIVEGCTPMDTDDIYRKVGVAARAKRSYVVLESRWGAEFASGLPVGREFEGHSIYVIGKVCNHVGHRIKSGNIYVTESAHDVGVDGTGGYIEVATRRGRKGRGPVIKKLKYTPDYVKHKLHA